MPIHEVDQMERTVGEVVEETRLWPQTNELPIRNRTAR